MVRDIHQEMEWFHEALERVGDERARFLEELAQHSSEAARRVERLLEGHARAIDTPTIASPTPARGRMPKQVDQYEIIGKIGEGGMGVVFAAEQLEPVRRRVALKLLRSEFGSARTVQRFHAERQTLARMSHPNIAQILDAGVFDDQPYFVMELVHGPPITQYCRSQQLDLKARLALFESVVRAVQHAHQKGIIHRDLKPSNILVNEVDGRPEVKVIDFGIARAVKRSGDLSAMTQTRQIVGTPLYMPPEQAAGADDIDTRADVYSLGVLLYELLTGSTPLPPDQLASVDPVGLPAFIDGFEPPRPSIRLRESIKKKEDAGQEATAERRLERVLKSDLDWVVLRAIAKRPRERYATANALAEDIRRFLEHEPVEAGPPSALYRVRKLLRRRRIEFAAVGLLCLAVLGVAVGSTIAAIQARLANERVTRSERETRKAKEQTEAELARAQAFSRFAGQLFSSLDPLEAQGEDTVLLRRLIERASARIDEELRDYPEAAAEMWSTIGTAYQLMGDYRGALTCFDQARALIENLTSASAYAQQQQLEFDRAEVLVELGEHSEAVRRFEDLVRRWTEEYGRNVLRTIEARSALGAAYHADGQLRKARDFLEKVLEDARRVAGVRDPITLSTMNTLGVLYSSLGQKRDALKIQEAVVEAQVELLGERHPRVLASLNNLGNTLADLGEIERAIQTTERVLAIKRKLLDKQHPSLFASLVNLGGQYSQVRRFDDAEHAYTEAETVISELPKGDWRRVAVYNGRARIHVEQKQYTEAEPWARKAVAVADSSLGPDHANTLILLANYASVLLETGALDEVETKCAEALPRAKRILGPNHMTTINFEVVRARAGEKAGDSKNCESALLEIYERVSNANPKSSPAVIRNVAQQIVRFYRRTQNEERRAYWEGVLGGQAER